jgi:hypothetical protein
MKKNEEIRGGQPGRRNVFWSELPVLALGLACIMIPRQGPAVHFSWLHFGVSGVGEVDVWRPVGGHWYLQGPVKDRYIYRQTPALWATSGACGQRQCLSLGLSFVSGIPLHYGRRFLNLNNTFSGLGSDCGLLYLMSEIIFVHKVV